MKNKNKRVPMDLNTFAEAFNALVRQGREPGEGLVDRRLETMRAYLSEGAALVLAQCTEDLGAGLGLMLEPEALAASLSICVSSVGAINDEAVRAFHSALVALEGGDALWRRILSCLAAANADGRFAGYVFDERDPKRVLEGLAPAKKPVAPSNDVALFDLRPDELDEDGLESDRQEEGG